MKELKRTTEQNEKQSQQKEIQEEKRL